MLRGQRVRVGSTSGCGIRACLGIFLANVLMWDGSWAAAILYNALTAWHSRAWFLESETVRACLAGAEAANVCPPGIPVCVTDTVLGKARTTCTSRMG